MPKKHAETSQHSKPSSPSVPDAYEVEPAGQTLEDALKNPVNAKDGPRIFISAGETSGDLHAAGLVRALRRLAPGAEIDGLGGDRMEQAGCKLLARSTGTSLMFVDGIISQLATFMGMISAIDRHFAHHRPDVVVLVDCPGFNFLVASRVRVRKIPVMWYIPPQLWAWGRFRIKKLRRRITRIACVFPHEEKFFRERGIEATFVGHPLAEHLRAVQIDKSLFARRDAEEKLVAILPGSRSREVNGCLPRMLRVAQALKARLGKVKFAMGCPNEEILALARPHVDSSPVDVETFVGKTNNLMAAADFALVVSGTATLELAWFDTPMVVLYHVPQYRYKLVAHLFMHTSLYSLPNVLLGRRLVPEFITYWGPDEPIIDEAVALLTDEGRIKAAKQGFKEIRESLDMVGASERAAEEALGLIGTPVSSPSPWRPGFYV